jgi:putative peptidoglycan lipid II flippase
MCATSLLFAISFALGEMLVARQRFLAYGIAPLLYNSGIVLGALVLGPRMGILGVAIGTVLGSVLHLGARLVGVLRTDASVRPALEIRTAAFREYVRLAIPRMISEPIEALTFGYFVRSASAIAIGGVSAVSYARNFQSVPVSLIGIAFAVAAFPVLSAAAAANDRPRFVRTVGINIASITVITTVGALLMSLLATRIIDLFLGGEAFDAEDVALTASVLAAFTLSIPLEALTHLLARAVFATRNTILPVIASIVGLLVTIGAVELLRGDQGLVALPLAFAAGQGVKVLILGGALLLRIRDWGTRPDRLATETPPS